MEVEWKKDIHKSYLLLKKEGDNSYCVNMLMNNSIRGLIRPDLKRIDAQCVFSYEVTGLQSISHIIEKLRGEELRNLIFELMEILEEGKEYLLSEDDYVLDPEYMFYSISKKELRLCYLDGYHKNVREQLCEWMEYLMGKIDHKDRENVVLVYGLHQISAKENATFADWKQYRNTYQEGEQERPKAQGLEEAKEESLELGTQGTFEKEGAEEEREEKAKEEGGGVIWKLLAAAVPVALFFLYQTGALKGGTVGGIDGKKLAYALVVAALLEAYAWSRLPYIPHLACAYKARRKGGSAVEYGQEECVPLEGGQRADAQGEWLEGGAAPFEEVTVKEWEEYGADEGEVPVEEDEVCESTVVLVETAGEKRYLLKAKEGEVYQDIPIEEFPFFIGKLKAKADGVIESKLISRYHAKIHREKDEFYLTDLASTNGTFLNGSRLGTNEKRRLCVNDEVGFANISYRFVREDGL